MAALKRALDEYLRTYNHIAPTPATSARGRVPADIVFGAQKDKTREMSQNRRYISGLGRAGR